MAASTFLAEAQTETALTVDDWHGAGIAPVTQPAVLVTGQNLVARAPVGRIAASGKIKIWNPAGSDGSEKACGIMLHAIDATAADKNAEIYIAGEFNIDLVAWPGGTTAAQKALAFDNTKIGVRKFGWSG